MSDEFPGLVINSGPTASSRRPCCLKFQQPQLPPPMDPSCPSPSEAEKGNKKKFPATRWCVIGSHPRCDGSQTHEHRQAAVVGGRGTVSEACNHDSFAKSRHSRCLPRRRLDISSGFFFFCIVVATMSAPQKSVDASSTPAESSLLYPTATFDAGGRATPPQNVPVSVPVPLPGIGGGLQPYLAQPAHGFPGDASLAIVSSPFPVLPISEWHTGLFDIFADCRTCLMGTFCFGCLTAQNLARLELRKMSFVDYLLGISLCFCTLYCGLWCIEGSFDYAARSELELRYGIRSKTSSDFLSAFLCCFCAGCQHSRELDWRANQSPQIPLTSRPMI